MHLREFNNDGVVSVSLLFGRSKMAPTRTTSIPRLELCSAVLATQAIMMIRRELDVQIDEEIYYSDSKVVLGYIQNESRRFYVYVAIRVQHIRNVTAPSQWRYIDTARNPADLATSRVTPEKLVELPWTLRPEFLRNPQLQPQASLLKVPLSESDPEVITCATATHLPQSLGCERFKRFSSWSFLRRAVASLIAFIRKFKERNQALSNKPVIPRPSPSAAELEQAGQAVIKAVQKEVFPAELKVLSSAKIEKSVPKHSNLLHLDPLVDSNGLLLVGGRLENLTLEYQEKHPVTLPKGSSCIGVDHPPLPRKRPSPRTPHHKRGSSRGWLLGCCILSNDIQPY